MCTIVYLTILAQISGKFGEYEFLSKLSNV